MYVCIYVYMYVCICVCVYAYIYIYTRARATMYNLAKASRNVVKVIKSRRMGWTGSVARRKI
jgi:hypothetical protein